MTTEIFLVTITARGANLAAMRDSRRAALSEFVGDVECDVALTQNGTAERVVGDSGPEFRATYDYEVRLGAPEPDAEPEPALTD